MLKNHTEELRGLYQSSKDIKLKERYHALYCISLGYSIEETATLFCKDSDTISTWMKNWTEEKIVADKSKSGRPPVVSKALEKELCRVVEEDNPSKEGSQCASWDCVELSKWLAFKGVSATPEWIRRLLIRNGFHYVKAKYNFLKKDENQRKIFINGFFEEAPLLGFENIFFADEASHKLHPKQGGKWTREKEAFIDTNCSHARVVTSGAVCPETGEFTAVQADRNDANTFINLLQVLTEKVSGIVHVIVDNYMVHKSKAVRDFLLKNGRINLHFLPKYSPDLNPIEWLWGWIRRKRTNNRLFQTKEELKEALRQIFANLDPQTIQSVCTYKVLRHRITY